VDSLQILTPEQVAELFQVSVGWVHEKSRRRSKNPLPAHRVGRYVRFKRSEVEAWFDSTLEAPKKGRAR
jgi:excisionase family DNA binding protein